MTEDEHDGPETITVERRGGVRLMGLNRPDKRNAFNVQMLHELWPRRTT
jgi:enoyl-CoA hydratase/carnithine racemase